MILTFQEIKFINIINSLNQYHIRYWIVFNSIDIDKYDSLLTSNCIYLSPNTNSQKQFGLHTYIIYISDDEYNVDQFKQLIDNLSYLPIFEDYYFKNNKLHNRHSCDHIQLMTYFPFYYNQFQTNYILNLWCLQSLININDHFKQFQSNCKKYMQYIYHQDFGRTYINIKGINIKIQRTRHKTNKQYSSITTLIKKSWWNFLF